MPTGYTAGILDGKITTFPQFAKLCMRAFGATIHMRDDDLDVKYEPRTPSKYYIEAIKKAKNDLEKLKSTSDKKLIIIKKKELEESKKYYLESIKTNNTNKIKLEKILEDIEKWNPPTKEHIGIKTFMIEQIKTTIEYDCNDKYNQENLIKINEQLNSLNANLIRTEKIEALKHNIEYHTNAYNKDLKGCKESNKWITDFLKSL